MWLDPKSADFLKELLEPPSQFKDNEDTVFFILKQVNSYIKSKDYKKKKNLLCQRRH